MYSMYYIYIQTIFNLFVLRLYIFIKYIVLSFNTNDDDHERNINDHDTSVSDIYDNVTYVYVGIRSVSVIII